MRFAFDTNILVYAADHRAGLKHEIAVGLLHCARQADCVVLLQSLTELYRVLVGKAKLDPGEAQKAVKSWRAVAPVFAADEYCLDDAMAAVIDHRISFWDAMMWATARRAGCRLLISEDGQDGHTLGGVTFVNPFTATPSPLLAEALGPARSPNRSPCPPG